MKLALIHPPACDPTAPYIALPVLAAFLRARGRQVVAIDANIEAFDSLLSASGTSAVRDRVEARLAVLDRLAQLSHVDAVRYAALWRARAEARVAPASIEDAKAVLRDPQRFFDPAAYGRAVGVIEAALRAVSAAYAPTFVDFMTYRTPFGLTSAPELAASASDEEFPFARYLSTELVPRLRREGVRVVGLSVCFPGQLHPAYIFGLRLREALPGVHLTVGGPGITQVLARLSGARLIDALAPFDSAVLFEGEVALSALLDAIESGRSLAGLPNVVSRESVATAASASRAAPLALDQLPAPDYEDLPLSRYLAPVPVLPYDPTRGCYWGRCAFCHYGLAERGTAKYRERPLSAVVEHLTQLPTRYGTRHVYLSHDSVAPKTIVALAGALAERGAPVRWATDLKPEPYIDAARSQTLRSGGAVACALGVESAANRVLRLIDKGQPIQVVTEVIRNLTGAGIAVEAMCFTDFPTETLDEALQTLRFLKRERGNVAGFIVGEFGLTHGSRIAQDPGVYGIAELWSLEGDRLGLALQMRPQRDWKTNEQRERIDDELGRVSSGWALRPYPWAGAVSTAHTILYYDRFGPTVFRDLARDAGAAPERLGGTFDADAAFDLSAVWRAEEREAELWSSLVFDRREVTRSAYDRLARAEPALERSPRRYRFGIGRDPSPAHEGAPRRKGARRKSRR